MHDWHFACLAPLFGLALDAITDICRALRLATMLAVVAAYFLKWSVARCALKAASLS